MNIAQLPCDQPHVALIELRRPPYNHLNVEALVELAEALERLDADPECRAVVLAAEGKAFSAGGEFSQSGGEDASSNTADFYGHALRLFRTAKPIVAAVHGAAIGAGLGLAVAADFRVTCSEARFSANFNRLGIHPGFGLSFTLPRLVGEQQAALLFYTGRRISGEEAHRIGLADVLVAADGVRSAALALAAEIAVSAPLAVESTRATLRSQWVDQVYEANQKELALQRVQFASEDFREGVAAMAERRPPVFQRR